MYKPSSSNKLSTFSGTLRLIIYINTTVMTKYLFISSIFNSLDFTLSNFLSTNYLGLHSYIICKYHLHIFICRWRVKTALVFYQNTLKLSNNVMMPLMKYISLEHIVDWLCKSYALTNSVDGVLNYQDDLPYTPYLHYL